MAQDRDTVGWREWLRFPTLGIDAIKAKVDTGARTSCLHAFELEPFERDGQPWVAFALHPLQRDEITVVRCEAPVVDQRQVRDSGGHAEQRYVIAVPVELGTHRFEAEVTLTSRDTMLFRCLLGRTALRGRFLVDPGRSYLVGRRPEKAPADAEKGQTS
ncbi:MAG TPA: ATP-dependent zinc protease [Pseudohaliea sp.]|nr:ATP-dependent zinc protease [Pseudohaliea sp.]